MDKITIYENEIIGEDYLSTEESPVGGFSNPYIIDTRISSFISLDNIADGMLYSKILNIGMLKGKLIVAGLDSEVTVRMFSDSDAKTNVEAWKHASDVTMIDGGDIYTGSITALGIVTAGSFVCSTTGYLRGGQTAYNTGTGFWLGYETDKYKFSIGNSAGNKFTWDGSALTVIGTMRTSASGQRAELYNNEFNFYDASNLVVKIGTTYVDRIYAKAYSGTRAFRADYMEANAQTLVLLYDNTGADCGTMLSVDRNSSTSDSRIVSITADGGTGIGLYLRSHSAVGVPLIEAVHQDLDKTGFFFTDETGNNPNNIGFVEIVADSASGALGTCLYLYASVNRYSHIRFAGGGSGPASPVGGDFWFDGTNLKIRAGATTYTLDKTAV